jgi:hypothetical protein
MKKAQFQANKTYTEEELYQQYHLLQQNLAFNQIHDRNQSLAQERGTGTHKSTVKWEFVEEK